MSARVGLKPPSHGQRSSLSTILCDVMPAQGYFHEGFSAADSDVVDKNKNKINKKINKTHGENQAVISLFPSAMHADRMTLSLVSVFSSSGSAALETSCSSIPFFSLYSVLFWPSAWSSFLLPILLPLLLT